MKATSASAPASGMALYSEARMPPDHLVPLQRQQASGLGFGDEAGIELGIGQEERDVHPRTGRMCDLVAVEAARAVDGAVHQRGLCGVALGELGHAAFGQHPLEHQASQVPVPGRRGVEHRIAGDVRAVIEDVRTRLATALEQVAADDHHRDADRAEVLLRASIDHAITAHVQRLAGDGRAEISDQRNVAGVGHITELDAVDGLVGGDVHVGGIG